MILVLLIFILNFNLNIRAAAPLALCESNDEYALRFCFQKPNDYVSSEVFPGRRLSVFVAFSQNKTMILQNWDEKPTITVSMAGDSLNCDCIYCKSVCNEKGIWFSRNGRFMKERERLKKYFPKCLHCNKKAAGDRLAYFSGMNFVGKIK